jgi:glutamyl-tRNA reductase
MEILVVGLNHNTAPVEIREKVTFSESGEVHPIRSLAELPGIEEIMALATCNRAEVIAVVEDSGAVEPKLITKICELHGLSSESLTPYLYVRKGAEAVRHVFRVASSLDSMVLGEPQILGQVKEAYRAAAELGTSGPILNRLMHRGFFSAKRVRTETAVGSAAVSVAYVAVELAKKILGELKKKTVLLIGAGEMAELAAKHLLTNVETPIVVVNRTFSNACDLANRLCGKALEMDKLYDALLESDVVITSTGSCEPVIKADAMKTVMRKRRYRPLFLIDIAIPRDVEPSVNDVDEVYLYNIDDLQSVVQENLGERKQEAVRGEAIVNEETERFIAWTKTLESTPTIVALRDKLEKIRSSELNRLNGKLSKLSPAEREIVEMVTKSIINKIAHDPIVFLKKTGSRAKRNQYLDIAQRLFRLDNLSAEADKTEEPDEESYHRN